MDPASASPSIPLSHKRARADTNNGDTTSRRRHRVREACDTCRARKDRCCGSRPACDNCLRARRPCTYRPTKKRGLRTGYVRALETLLGSLLSTVQGLDPWVASLFEGQEIDPMLHLNHLGCQSTDASTEPFVETWRKSSLLKQIEQALSAEVSEEDEGTESGLVFNRKALQACALAAGILRTRTSAGQESFDTSLPTPRDCHSALLDTPAEESANQIPPSSYDHRPTDHSTDPELIPPEPMDLGENLSGGYVSHQANRQFLMPLPVHWRSLLDMYFCTTHCWLPISQKHDLLRTAYVLASLSGSQTTAVPTSQGERVFLMAVLAYSSFLIESGDKRTMPSTDDVGRQQASASSSAIRVLLPEDFEAYDIGHVRALLILTLISIHFGDQKQAWVTTGSANYAITILAKSHFRQEQSAEHLDEGVKRTILCSMALDSLVAAWIGLRPYFTRSDIVNVGPLMTEGLEEWEPWKSDAALSTPTLVSQSPARSLSTFNQFINLVGILNDMLRSSNGVLTRTSPQLFQSIVSDWRSCVPSFNDVESSSTPQRLNCDLLTACLKELIRLQSDVGDSGQSTESTHCRLWKIDSVSRGFIKDVGISFVPPTCNISMFVLRLSVDHRAHPQNGFETELRNLQTRLHELDKSHYNLNLELHNREQDQLQASFLPQDQFQFTRSESSSDYRNERPEASKSLKAAAAMRADELNTARAISPQLDPEWNHLTPTDVPAHNPALSFPDTNPPTLMPNVMSDSMVATVSDDSLFLSLADLDSSDWSANVPDFMRRLGVPDDSTTSMDRFFGANPG